MAKKINDSQKSVFLDYLSEIERNKIWPLSGEISYKKHEVDSFENYIATQLFNENISELKQEDVEETIWFVKWWKHNLIELKWKITDDSFLTNGEKKFLLSNIENILTRMDLVLKWIYIEAEKWWYKLDKEQRDSLKQEIQELSYKIRWPKVSDVPHEKFLVLKNIHDKYNEKKDVLTEEEQNTISQFFERFGISSYFNMLDNDDNTENKSTEKGIKLDWVTINLDKYVYIIKMILEKIYWIPCVFVSKWQDFRTWEKISKNSYDEDENIVLINWDSDDYDVNKFFEKNNILEKFRITIDPKKWNLSASAWNLNVPYKQSYKNMNITKFLSLIEHELKHVIRARKSSEALPVNIDKKIDNISLSKQEKWFKEYEATEIEEWITKFSEEAVYQNIEDMQADVSIWHIATFIWENYCYDEWKELLKIYLKLDWNDEENAEKTSDIKIRRVKRFFPLDEPGAYWKDTLYYRSKKNIIELVQLCQKNKDPKKLEELAKTAYMAKLWWEDIEKFQDMIKSMTPEKSYDEIPYEIWKIIYTKLSGESLKDMEKKDIRFSINQLNTQQKRVLVEILKYTKDSLRD